MRDLFHNYNPYLLSDLDKTAYLIDKLRRQEIRSYDFYKVWFECFLCDENYIQTDYESQQFHQLLEEWSNKFQYDRDLLEKISIKMDAFLEKLTTVTNKKANDRRVTYFIKRMIDIYFQQSKKYFIYH